MMWDVNHTEQISTTDFPETFQQLFTEIQRTKSPLTVMHQGQPLVVIYPAATQSPRPMFGVMKDSGAILGDLLLPVVPTNEWEALQ